MFNINNKDSGMTSMIAEKVFVLYKKCKKLSVNDLNNSGLFDWLRVEIFIISTSNI